MQKQRTVNVKVELSWSDFFSEKDILSFDVNLNTDYELKELYNVIYQQVQFLNQSEKKITETTPFDKKEETMSVEDIPF